MYLDDAAGDRLWVDSEECRPFVDNVVTAFGTRLAPKSMLQPDVTLAGRPDCPSPPGAACESRAGGRLRTCDGYGTGALWWPWAGCLRSCKTGT